MKKQPFDYWQSYSDLLAAILLLFMFLFALAASRARSSETDVSAKNERLVRLERRLKESGEAYVNLEAQLARTSEMMEELIGVRSEIVQSLSDSFRESQIAVLPDQETGALLLDSAILFDTNRAELKAEGTECLEQLLPVYFQVLWNYREYIAEISIEGNCDSRGTYEANLLLSLHRASTVALYGKNLLGRYFTEEESDELLRLIRVSGRSNTNPIYEDGAENLDASRRVEIRFTLRDEEMITKLNEILKEGA